MKTLQELKNHFDKMSIEQLEQESKRLFLSMNESNEQLLFSASIAILFDRISEYEFDNFIKALQQ